MGPQCEDGYTQIANELLDALYTVRIPGEAMQIFLFILRKTYGFKKKNDVIALSQFAATGITKTHISRAISKLEEMNLIVTQKGNKNGISYGINKHFSTWKSLPKKVTLPKKVMTVTQKGNKPLPKKGTTKETTKETITKERLEICEAWKSFVEMRKAIKKPMTPDGMKLAVNKLFKLMDSGNDPIQVLQQSVFNNWQGLFEVKGQKPEPKTDNTPMGTPEQLAMVKRMMEAKKNVTA